MYTKFPAYHELTSGCKVSRIHRNLFRVLTIVLFIVSGISSAWGVSVTFKVDMSQQMISPNGVHLAGNFQGWDPSATQMTDIGGGIYCIVLDLPPGVYQFKFINGNAWGLDETVPTSCGVNDGSGIYNRQIVIGLSDIILSAYCFGECALCGPSQYFSNGSSLYLGGSCYQITPPLPWQNGTLWNNTQIDLLLDFNLQFSLNLGSNDAGADGLVFVLQQLGTGALGISGGGMGYSSFGTSLGIEFDTFYNPEFNDPIYDHIAIEINGDVDHASTNSLAGPVQMSPFTTNTEDGNEHVVQIIWNAATKTITVYFDCQQVIQATYDLVNNLFGGQSLVYWGFTGATGAEYNMQTVCVQPNAVVTSEYSVCPGGAVLLSAGASSTGLYNWFPATHLNDPTAASPVATPPATTMYTVVTTDLCGANTTHEITVNVLENDPLCALLPVSLMEFEIQPDQPNLIFKWTTLSETQNAFFTIEESSDGLNYSSFKYIQGAGFSWRPKVYRIASDYPRIDTYYRLSQTDFNGTYTVLTTGQLIRAEFKELHRVYYNAQQSNLIIWRNSDSELLYVSVYMPDGRLLQRYQLPVGGGQIQEFTLNNHSGLYLITLQNSRLEKVLQQKIVVH